jgi:mRNA-degrading endonuclease YafQ of YafQ-DinJ toxin-antitoxin module
MNAVFEPSLLFISNENWQDEDKQDLFLKHLINQLEIIDKFDISKIWWTDELQTILIGNPNMHPWFGSDLRNPIIVAISQMFYNRIEYIYESETMCQVSPNLTVTYTNEFANEHFLKLVHTLIVEQNNFYFCVGIENQLFNSNKYSFYCNCHQNKLSPILINIANNWYPYLDSVGSFFPTSIEEFDEKFKKAIEITVNCDFVGSELLYEYVFEKNFKKSVIGTARNRTEILKNITKRLTLTTPQAQADGSLQDKPYKGTEKKGIRRMRITQGTRVDYLLHESEKKIVFINYFDEGDYDKSL